MDRAPLAWIVLVLVSLALGCEHERGRDLEPELDAGPSPGIDAGPSPGIDAGPSPGIDAGPSSRPDAAAPSTDAGPGCTDELGTAPRHCSPGQRCSYEASPYGCDRPGRIDAECNEGSWQVWQPASCDPPAADPSCDPVGTWELEFAFDPDAGTPLVGSCLPEERATVVIRRALDGSLQLKDVFGRISADGCAITLHWDGAWKNPSENGSEDYDVDLELDSSGASGTVRHRTYGFCPTSHAGTVIATRSS